MRSIFLRPFWLANKIFFALVLGALIIECISRGDFQFLMDSGFWLNMLSDPLMWFSYLICVVLPVTGLFVYAAVVRNRKN